MAPLIMSQSSRNRKNFLSINGILAILFGLVAIFFPGITIAALGVYFAVFILLGGIILTVNSLRIRKSNSHWYLLLTEGIIGILIAILILLNPEMAATIFVTIIGLWAVILGLIYLATYFKSRIPSFSNSFLLSISILSLILGILILTNPFESTRVITVIIGIYAITYGIFSIVNSAKIYN